MINRVAVAALAVAGTAFAQVDCPDPDVVEVQPIDYVIEEPILITGYFPTPTTIDLGNGLTVPINGPTSISTVVTATSHSQTAVTVTKPADGSDGNGNGGGTVTVTAGYPGSTTGAVTLPPGSEGGTVTVIVQTPEPTFTGPFTTVTEQYGGSTTRFITLDPSGTDTVGTVIEQVPITSYTGPYTTVTGIYDGTTTRYITLPPGEAGGLGTVIVEEPGAGGVTTITGGVVTITTTGADGGVVTVTTTAPGTTVTAPGETDTTTVTADETTSAAEDTTSADTTSAEETTSSETTSAETTSSETTSETTSAPTTSETTSAEETTSSETTSETTSAEETTTSSEATTTEAPTTTTEAPTSTTCVPTTATATPACFSGLPEACDDIADANGLALIPLVPLCVAALGPYAVGSAATCLATSAISLTSVGSDIIDCLNDALDGTCIDELPEECTELADTTGLALIPLVATCAVRLGPFAIGSAAVCLSTSSITAATGGDGIVTCLETALGLADPTDSGEDETCVTAPTETCVTQLPPDCDLADTDGLALITAIPLCVAALGTYGVGNAATCLTTTSISASSVGQDVVDCLLNAFEETCISTLPAACSSLATDSTVELVVDIPLCTVALGPFAAGDALTCLSTSTGSGSDIVECLNNAIFGNLDETLTK